eukprot:COSAG02_NODE_699_length_18369_cov_9.690203_3_plen_151_part_00
MEQVSAHRFTGSHASFARADSVRCTERSADVRRRRGTLRLPALGAAAVFVQGAISFQLALCRPRLEEGPFLYVYAGPLFGAVLACQYLHIVLRCAVATVHDGCGTAICNGVVVHRGRVGAGGTPRTRRQHCITLLVNNLWSDTCCAWLMT